VVVVLAGAAPAVAAPDPIVQLDLGNGSGCAVKASGSLVCWGNNNSAELGDGTRRSRQTPAPALVTDVVQVSVHDRAFAVRRNGTVVCLGCGDKPVPVAGLKDIVQVADGGSQSCAVHRTGAVSCWDRWGTPAPVRVKGITDALTIAGGQWRMCATTRSGRVACWRSDEKIVVEHAIDDAVAVSVGREFACALRKSGAVWCWGAAYALGNGKTDEENETTAGAPGPVKGLTDAVSISAGEGHACAIRKSGAIACWGSNDFGALGIGKAQRPSAPVAVSGITDAVLIAAGDYETCAVRRSGATWCWGNNVRYQPAEVVGLEDAISVSAGAAHSCAIGTKTGLSCWGDNATMRGTEAAESTRPLPQPGLGDAVHVNLSQTSSRIYDYCAVRKGGEVVCREGGTTVKPGVLDAVSVGVGQGHACAARKTGAVACWGRNDAGQFGDGSAIEYRPTAGPVSGISDAIAVGAGMDFACALRRGGSVACWGLNEDGQLGNGVFGGNGKLKELLPDKASKPRPSKVPVAVKGIDDAIQIATARYHVCVLRRGGTVSCWGSNFFSRLGPPGDYAAASLPLAVPGLSGVASISAGGEHMCVTRKDGTAACWGKLSDSLQLGEPPGKRLYETGLQDAIGIGAGHDHACAVRKSGRVACWGPNEHGEIGDGTGISGPAPFPGL